MEWKTENQQNNRKRFLEIQTNLENNRDNLKPRIKWYEERDSLIKLVKERKLNFEDYKSNKDLLTLINFYSSLKIEKSGYFKLKNYLGQTKPKYDSIMLKLNVLYDQIVPLNERYELVMENFNHRMHERRAQNMTVFQNQGIWLTKRKELNISWQVQSIKMMLDYIQCIARTITLLLSNTLI